MNKRVYILLPGAVILLAGTILAQGAGAPAQQAPAAQAQQAAPAPTGPAKFATVHIQRAIAECAEGKKASDDLTKRFTPKRNELEAKQAEIQKLQQQLQQGDKVLSDEQKAQLSREIERKTREFNRDNDDANADYQAAQDQFVNSIGMKMMQVIGEYSRRNGYDLILNSSNPAEVLWQTGRVDITDEIIGAFNLTFGTTGGGVTAPPKAPAGAPATKPAVTPPAVKKP